MAAANVEAACVPLRARPTAAWVQPVALELDHRWNRGPAVHARDAPCTRLSLAAACLKWKWAPNRAQHRIASIDQHPTSMVTTLGTAQGACEAVYSGHCSANYPIRALKPRW